MARARNIKPGFFTNEELVELPFSTRLLFIGMWTIADRAGRLEDRPKRIKMAVFPADDVDVDDALNQLQASGFLLRYEVDGARYIQILAFDKHQNPHKDEKQSSIPAPYEHHASTVQTPYKHGGNPADSLIPDSLSTDSGLLDGYAEPQSDSAPVIVAIPLVGGKEFPVLQTQVDEWTAAYPAVDVIRQLAAMRQWCLANPTRRKTARGVLSFCNSWLMREQDKPRPQARGSPVSRNDRSAAAAAIFGSDEPPQREIIDVN